MKNKIKGKDSFLITLSRIQKKNFLCSFFWKPNPIPSHKFLRSCLDGDCPDEAARAVDTIPRKGQCTISLRLSNGLRNGLCSKRWQWNSLIVLSWPSFGKDSFLPGCEPEVYGARHAGSIFFHCGGLKHVSPQLYVHQEPQNMTLFGNQAFAYIIIWGS